MSIESNNDVAKYNCLKKIYGPEIFKKIDERNADFNMLTGKDAVYTIFLNS